MHGYGTDFSAKEEESEIKRVLQTVATENMGISTLLDSVDRFAHYITANGIKEKRRDKALDAETIDWVIEMLRPKFIQTMTECSEKSDPRVRAQELINTFKLQ